MKTFLPPIVLASLLFMSLLCFGFVKNAEAIIGMTRTPLSFAGVARRSMYREAAVASTVAVTNAAAMNAAAANAAAANAAPAQASAANAAAEAHNCAGIYYRAGFQGNNIVYIVSAP